MDTPPKSFIESFLEELQALERPTKTKILVISTAVLMLIVIYFWLAYFNGIILGAASVTDSDQNQPVPVAATSPQPDFWGKVGNETANVGFAIGGGMERLEEIFHGSKEYMIR